MPCARQSDRSAPCPRRQFRYHHEGEIAGNRAGGDQGAADETGPGCEDLAGPQAITVGHFLELQPVIEEFGVPDAEKMPLPRVFEQSRALRTVAVARDQLERVDMALIDSAEGEAAAPDDAQHATEVRGPRFFAKPGAVLVPRDWRGKQAERAKMLHIGRGKPAIVIMLGRPCSRCPGGNPRRIRGIESGVGDRCRLVHAVHPLHAGVASVMINIYDIGIA